VINAKKARCVIDNCTRPTTISKLQQKINKTITRTKKKKNEAFVNDDEYLLLLEGIFSLMFLLYDSNITLAFELLTQTRAVQSTSECACTQAHKFLNSSLEQLQDLLRVKLEESKNKVKKLKPKL
ncbi:hypothetical protein RFI_37334, partial [Reticulomyxa filosa]